MNIPYDAPAWISVYAAALALSVWLGMNARHIRDMAEIRGVPRGIRIGWAGTPMGVLLDASARAAVIESAWAACFAAGCMCRQPWGMLAGAAAALFRTGFDYARETRPWLFRGDENSAAADMSEYMIYAELSAAMIAAAIFMDP